LIIRIGGGGVVEPDDRSSALEEYLARIRQLEEENAHLREAAKTFGDLAERLKRALDAELRRESASARDRISDRNSQDCRIAVDAGQASR
jgi:hypothetical protein